MLQLLPINAYKSKMSAPIENTFIREVETNNGKTLEIHQSEVGDVGCVVWDAALVLSKYIEKADFKNGESWRGKNVIEIGAGTGVLGILLAVHGANVTITDLPEFLPLINLNISTNKQHLTGTAVAKSLKWGEETIAGQFDCVVLADCIYYDKSLEPLVEALVSLCTKDTNVLCCYEQRITEHKLELEKKFLELIDKSFYTEDIPLERQDAHFRSEDILIKKFKLKEVGNVT